MAYKSSKKIWRLGSECSVRECAGKRRVGLKNFSPVIARSANSVFGDYGEYRRKDEEA
ncbi:MAG TPA: hypothetical protein VGP72_04700 [Planctomycetota bacterium]|jgi:hypothetical protein